MKTREEIKTEIEKLKKEIEYHSKKSDNWSKIEKETDSIRRQNEATWNSVCELNKMNDCIAKIKALEWILGKEE